jgi:hypothetical protein
MGYSVEGVDISSSRHYFLKLSDRQQRIFGPHCMRLCTIGRKAIIEDREINVNLKYLVERFSANRAVFEGLVNGVGPEQATWKPTANEWSILEVINHLYDEE